MRDYEMRKAVELARECVRHHTQPSDIRTLARALLALHATVERQAKVVEAAKIWRQGLIELNGRWLDSDDGNAEQGMSRPPSAVVLIRAIDALDAKEES
jgi:hypothetical protein